MKLIPSFIFTSDSPADLQFLTFSSVGWNTGIGLFAFRPDKLDAMEQFRAIIRGIEIEGKRFESYPKQMLLNRYALTVYFNSAFKRITDSIRLLFWLKQFNGFTGELELVETRHYPADHPTRKGCRIVAFEANQTFLDELYKFPKDHPFTVRFGGNLYIRGGERIDPDDPDAVKTSRLHLSRHAAKKLLVGAGDEVLNAGQTAEDSAAANARREHVRKQVTIGLYTDTRKSSISINKINTSRREREIGVGDSIQANHKYFYRKQRSSSNKSLISIVLSGEFNELLIMSEMLNRDMFLGESTLLSLLAGRRSTKNERCLRTQNYADACKSYMINTLKIKTSWLYKITSASMIAKLDNCVYLISING